jgi:conjugative relaxase-like TrwC/TraI family protein
MRALFGLGAHPNMDAIVDAYIDDRWRPWMTGERLDRLINDAIRSATLGRQFPRYRQLDPFEERVTARLDAVREYEGREPTQAEAGRVRAREARRQRDAVAGYDLVFSPVKSAALLWAVDPRPRVQEGIAAAHAAAKDAALALLEEHAAFTRTGPDGVAQIATRGLIAAEFEHWDSRAGDPNLHTHVAISSKVMGIDGIWRALDGRPLHGAAVAISEIYNTVFEAELAARLGVTFSARPGTQEGKEPVREIAGVPTAMVEHFSRRRAAIESRYAELERAYREEHGREPDPGAAQRLARQANLETRQGKRPPTPLADKRAAWREELTGRFGSNAIGRLMSVVPESLLTDVATNAPTAVNCADLAERTVTAVSARRSTWTVWNLRAEVERQLRKTLPALVPGQHREAADAITEAALARSVCVEPPPLLDEPTEMRRPCGESVFTQHAAARFTSQAVLDAETRLVTAARTLTAAGLSGPAVAAALDGFEARTGGALDPGQRHLVTVFAADARLLLADIGPAGAGKTTAMRALAHVLRQGGRNLIPLATSAAAADVLGRELGVRAENLHKFIHEWTAGPFAARLQSGESVPAAARMYRLGPGDVIVVDEAGMAGTFALDSLTTHAAKRGAVVRLLGDDRQLPAVDAGGALRLVAAEPGTPELTTLYRFRDPAEAAATLQLRTGHPDAIDWYDERDRIRGGSRQAMTQAAYEGWKVDMLAGKVTLMAALASADVTTLAARARADRVTAGQVEPDGARLRDGNLVGRGDWIVTRRNDRRLSVRGGRDWVKNGDAWTVERRHDDGALAIKNITHGGRITLPADYVAANVQLLYATTSHRAQGSTVDTAHPLITDNMTREALYVLASRARERTTLYVATHDQDVGSSDDAHVNAASHDLTGTRRVKSC